jgi:hypothetical protein
MCISSLLGVCDSHLGGVGGGGSSWGLLHFLFTSKSDVIKFHLVGGLDELHGVGLLCYNFFVVSAISHVDDIALQNFNVSSASCTESWTGCSYFVLF